MIDFDALSDNYFKRELSVKSIGRYYPSEVGQCLRKSWYSFLNPKEVEPDLAKIFEAGNILHEFVGKVFASEKNPDVELLEEESPFTIEVDDFVIAGRIDNLVLLKEQQRKAVVEVKSTKMLSMVPEPKPEHVMQLQLYLHAKGVQDGILLYVEKNTLKSKTFHLQYDPTQYEDILARFRKMHDNLVNSQLPKPEARLLEDKKWMCRYCNYRQECFQDTPETGLLQYTE